MRIVICAAVSCSFVLGAGIAIAQPASQPTSRPAASQPAREANPAAKGFRAEASDEKAIALADRTMAAMGGRRAWDETRYLRWTFFSGRTHTWDTHTGWVRVEWVNDGERQVVAFNLNTKEGRAWRDLAPINDPEARATMLEQGERAWINDAYWVFAPYKLKDSGVTLKYVGERTTVDGRDADVISATFDGVGVTPQNRYEFYVAKASGLVEQWDFFATATDERPRFQVPWRNWTKVGRIMLSGDRGRMQITGISTTQVLPDGMFTTAEGAPWPEDAPSTG